MDSKILFSILGKRLFSNLKITTLVQTGTIFNQSCNNNSLQLHIHNISMTIGFNSIQNQFSVTYNYKTYIQRNTTMRGVAVLYDFGFGETKELIFAKIGLMCLNRCLTLCRSCSHRDRWRHLRTHLAEEIL